MDTSHDTIEKLVENTFSNGKNREYVEGYLVSLRENWRDCHAAIERNSTMILVLAVVFELLSRAAIGKASLGPFEVKDFTPVQLGLPVIIAYLFYRLWLANDLRLIVRQVHDEVIRVTRKDIYNNGMHLPIAPLRSAILAIGFAMPRLHSERKRRFVRNLTTPLTLIFALGFLVFEGYAYYILFRSLGYTNIAVWIGLLISLYFIVLVFASF
jgi:hypothetical protein